MSNGNGSAGGMVSSGRRDYSAGNLFVWVLQLSVVERESEWVGVAVVFPLLYSLTVDLPPAPQHLPLAERQLWRPARLLFSFYLRKHIHRKLIRHESSIG